MKVQSSIQIRCHQAQTEELAIACELTSDYLPDADYCRDVLNIAPEQFAADFDNRVDVQPVSDPNAITGTQKLVIAQALVDRAAAAPDLYNRRAVEKRLLETMRLPNADELLVDQSQAPRMGPSGKHGDADDATSQVIPRPRPPNASNRASAVAGVNHRRRNPSAHRGLPQSRTRPNIWHGRICCKCKQRWGHSFRQRPWGPDSPWTRRRKTCWR